MSFCIECGAKAPDIAKFCPQCGTAISHPAPDKVQDIEPASSASPIADRVENGAEPSEQLIDNEVNSETDASETTITETTISDADAPEPQMSEPQMSEPLPSDDLASKSNDLTSSLGHVKDSTPSHMMSEPPKSKAGLFIGLGILALAAAGGGAYGLGLFGNGEKDVDRLAVVPEITASTPSPETSIEEAAEETLSPVDKAYRAAISSGRSSDLGNFARSYPDSSLAKDAEIAALASLNRQNTVEAYNAFNKQFPNADTSSYTGPREKADVDGLTSSGAQGDVLRDALGDAQSVGLLRYSITSRTAELEPFIEQGNTDYALAVIDELLAWTDLTEDEATFLLNFRAKAETAPRQEVQEFAVLKNYDTPAAPVERFGAITPDSATQPGDCDVEFSVGVSGKLLNIVPKCTHDIFIEPSREAVSGWTYTAASLNGTAVQQDAITVKLKFHLE